MLFRVESFSIGALVKMTGISADTIRTWERRYGYPKATRNEAGHRRYDLATSEFLVLAQRLISRGERPSEVLRLSHAELLSMLDPPDAAGSGSIASAQIPPEVRAQEFCMNLLLKVEQLDGAQVDKVMHTAWSTLGVEVFMAHLILPLLHEVGNRWEHGRFGVHHEHLFSARLRQFLGQHWQEMSANAQGPLVTMATPVGEEHELGLHVAAVYFALSGCRILFLGPCTPAQVLLDAARESNSDAVAISVSSTFAREAAQAYVEELGRVYHRAQILVGGSGGRFVQELCVRLEAPGDVQAWLERRPQATG